MWEAKNRRVNKERRTHWHKGKPKNNYTQPETSTMNPTKIPGWILVSWKVEQFFASQARHALCCSEMMKRLSLSALYRMSIQCKYDFPWKYEMVFLTGWKEVVSIKFILLILWNDFPRITHVIISNMFAVHDVVDLRLVSVFL